MSSQVRPPFARFYEYICMWFKPKRKLLLLEYVDKVTHRSRAFWMSEFNRTSIIAEQTGDTFLFSIFRVTNPGVAESPGVAAESDGYPAQPLSLACRVGRPPSQARLH